VVEKFNTSDGAERFESHHGRSVHDWAAWMRQNGIYADETWLEYAAQMLRARLVQHSEEVEGLTIYPHFLASFHGEDIPGMESPSPDMLDSLRQSHIDAMFKDAPTYAIAHVRFGTIVPGCACLYVM